MVKIKISLIVLIILVISSCTNNSSDNTALVDPMIGTDWNGHTFPGATLPNGLVQLSPDTKTTTWNNCSGYHYSDPSI
jgi:putative alpha-1,2-mannosidase